MVNRGDKECDKKPVIQDSRRIAAYLFSSPDRTNRILPPFDFAHRTRLHTGVSLVNTIKVNDKSITYTTMNNRQRLLYVGMDVHKDTHTAVATNCFGQELLELKISNSKEEVETSI